MIAIVMALFLQQEGVSREEFEKMKKEMEELKKKVDQQEPTEEKTLPERAQEEAKRKAGGVYSKPFLARFGRGVYVGGYMDLEYVRIQSVSKNDGFDQHRLVPFIYADVSEHVKVATEIEIEHGGEVGIEFATIDYWMADAINFRAGMILDPLGKFNLQHDAPYQDLTARPMVDTWIIPAVLREPGLGFFGAFDFDPWKIDYEIYLTNGFKGLDKAGTNKITASDGLKNARGYKKVFSEDLGKDFNESVAVVGRVAVSPFLGVEMGLSTHQGKYDEQSENNLGIYALDWTIDFGGLYNKFFSGGGFLRDIFFALEFVGEFAYADISRDDFAKSKGVINDMRGYYLEGRYHFMPEFLRKIIPGANEESTFTAVVRYDDTDLDSDVRSRFTLGLNFRPREDTVFKFEYQFNMEDEDVASTDNDAFWFSVATYF